MEKLVPLCYCLGIEVAKYEKGIVLSHQKYILDLLKGNAGI